MSSKEETPKCINDTLVRMITNLKPNLSHKILLGMNTPMKRAASSTSMSSEEASPVKKFKAKESDLFYIGSPREVRRIRADLVDARNKIDSYESRISQMHTTRKEMEIMYVKELKELKSQREKDKRSIDELETQLQSIRKRELGLKNELTQLKNTYKELKSETDIQIQQLESNVANLSSEIHVHNMDENTEVVGMKRKITQLEYMYNAAQEETEAHKKLVEDLNKRMAEKANLEAELEMKTQALNKAQMQVKDLEFAKANHIEFLQQAKLQQHKLSTYNDLEKENIRLKEEVKNLKDEVRNKLILEEEVHDLKSRLINFKEMEKKLTNLQVANAQTEMYLEEFRALGRSICETSTNEASLPRLLRNIVERLQQQEINLTSEKIQLESQMSTITHEAKVAKDELEKSQKHIATLQSSMKHHQHLIHRLQKKLSLISGERDSYRKQLDSYERDLTICVNPASSASPGTAQFQSQHERIQGLEKMVDGYRDMVHKLETDLQNVEPASQPEVLPIRAEQMSRLQDEIEKLKNENSLLRTKKDQLEVQLEEYLVGHDETKVRIYHNENNPLSECLKQRGNEKEKLEEEVDRLRRKIRKLEEGLEASKLGDVTLDHKEVKALKEQLHSSEQQLQRLKEYFKNSMQEFRNVIYMLLGFKIDKTSNSQYKLTSMYAEKSEDYLCFHLNSEGALNLLENEFSAALEEMVDLHLRHQRSIPVFLSALTMDLFNNKTMSKTYDVDDDSDDE